MAKLGNVLFVLDVYIHWKHKTAFLITFNYEKCDSHKCNSILKSSEIWQNVDYFALHDITSRLTSYNQLSNVTLDHKTIRS